MSRIVRGLRGVFLQDKGISLRQISLAGGSISVLGGGTGLFDFRLIQGPSTRATGHEIGSFLAMI